MNKTLINRGFKPVSKEEQEIVNGGIIITSSTLTFIGVSCAVFGTGFVIGEAFGYVSRRLYERNY